ncbi:hypothetical protein [Streptomyces shenzhenensis]|nr:hypothetical protein [Streptomyces shenzhenensis]
MDRRIETFELACSAQELMADGGEDDEVRALMTQLWLAHAPPP